MKNMISKYFRVALLVVATAYFSACKKAGDTIHIKTPNSSFTVSTRSYGLSSASTNYIDSNFYFKNLSDSSSTITYQWDFGDGTTSTLKNPKHKYAKKGQYIVSLSAVNNNQATDITKTTLTVVMGQKLISLGNTVNTQGIDMYETADKSFMLLGYTNSAITGGPYIYFLMKTDSLYNQQSVKNFPSAYRFSSFQPTADGNYILTGTTSGASSYVELIKMAADGSILWSKTIPGVDYITNAQQTPDGGYAVIGNQHYTNNVGNTIYYTTLTKTDANGNIGWSKVFNTGATVTGGAVNVVCETDGIVVAGNKPYTPVNNQYCSYCDSIIIQKLNNDGSSNWRNTVMWGLNYTTNAARIVKTGNGNYNVIPANINNKGVYFFSPDGTFLDRKLVTGGTVINAMTSDGNIMIMQEQFSNGVRSYMTKLDQQGYTQWSAYFPNSQQDTPVTTHPLKNGGNFFVGNKLDYMNGTYNYYSGIVVLQLAEDGSIK